MTPSSFHVAFVRDISERKREESYRQRELSVLRRLQRVSTSSENDDELQPALTEILGTAVEISRADFGNIQLLDRASGDLRIAVHCGFPQWWLDYWNEVSSGQGSCGTALQHLERVVVEDVSTDPVFVDPQL